MKNIEWGEYKYDELFTICTVKNKLTKNDLEAKGKIPVYSSESSNNGIVGFTNKKADFVVCENNPIYVVFGDHTISLNIATNSFCVMDNVKVLTLNSKLTINALLYIMASWKKCIPNKGYARHWSLAQKALFNLPKTKNNQIDFDFMESFIADLELERILKLENYLSEVGLNDYELTEKEKKTLESFESGTNLQNFRFGKIFNKIKQGKRLKKDDQVSGKTPFVMSGVTDTGVVNWISNPVQIFPKNSITIDIFGNTFYRNYSYGAGDDTGVYWNDEIKYSREVMIFFASAMTKSVSGKFDYGRKLRSSQSSDFEMMLPVKDSKPDYETMEAVVSAIHKLVIKDVVLYVERKKTELSFAATQEFQ